MRPERESHPVKISLLLLSLVFFLGSCASNPIQGCRENHPLQATLNKIVIETCNADRALALVVPHSCIIDGPKVFATIMPVEASGRMVPYLLVTSKLLDRIPSNDHLRAVVAYQFATFILAKPAPGMPYGSFPHEYSIDMKTRDLLVATRVSEPEKVMFETLDWIQKDYPTLADRKEQIRNKKQTPGEVGKKGQ